MMNPFGDISWKPDARAMRAFGRRLAAGLAVVSAILLAVVRWKAGAWAWWPCWIAGAGALLAALCRLAPVAARPVYVVWNGIACSVAFVVGNGVFVALFYLLITPVGLLLRVLGKDPLKRRRDPSAASYWEEPGPPTDSRNCFRQF